MSHEETTLHSFREPLAVDQLIRILGATQADVIRGAVGEIAATNEFDSGSSLIDVERVFQSLEEAAGIASGIDRSSSRKRGKIDALVVRNIHQPLAGLTRQSAATPGFWNWLACGPGREFLWMRWTELSSAPSGVEEVEAEITRKGSAVDGRFRMNSSSLNGVSRHALARLWWLGETLGADYDSCGKILANQDIFQAIYERQIGFVPGLSRDLIDVFELGSDRAPDGESFRVVMKAINQLASVTRIENLDEPALHELVDQIKHERRLDPT